MYNKKTKMHKKLTAINVDNIEFKNIIQKPERFHEPVLVRD